MQITTLKLIIISAVTSTIVIALGIAIGYGLFSPSSGDLAALKNYEIKVKQLEADLSKAKADLAKKTKPKSPKSSEQSEKDNEDSQEVDKINQLKTIISDLEEEITKLNSEKQQWRNDQDKTNTEYDEEIALLKQGIAQLKEQLKSVNDLKGKLETSDTTIKQLQDNLESAENTSKQQITDLQNQLKQSSDKNLVELNKTIQDQALKLEKCNETIKQLEATGMQNSTELNRLQAIINERDAIIRELELAMTQYSREVDISSSPLFNKLHDTLGQAIRRLKNTNNENERLKSAQSQYDQQLIQQTNTIADLEIRLEESKTAIEKFQQSLESKNAALDERAGKRWEESIKQKAMLEKADEMRTELQDQLKQTQSQYDRKMTALQKAIKEYESKLHESGIKINNLSESLKNENVISSRQITNLKTELRTANSTKTQLETSQIKYAQQLSQRDNTITDLKQRLNESKVMVKNLQRSLEDTKTAFNRRVDKSLDDDAAWDAKMKRADREKSNLQSQLAQNQSQYRKSLAELDAIITEQKSELRKSELETNQLRYCLESKNAISSQQVKSLKEKLTESGIKLQDAERKMSALETIQNELNDLQKTNLALNLEVTEFHQQVTESNKQLREARKTVNLLEADNAKLTKRLEEMHAILSKRTTRQCMLFTPRDLMSDKLNESESSDAEADTSPNRSADSEALHDVSIPAPTFFDLEKCDRGFKTFRNTYFDVIKKTVDEIFNLKSQCRNLNINKISEYEVADLIILTIYCEKYLDILDKSENGDVDTIIADFLTIDLRRFSTICITCVELNYVPFDSMSIFGELKNLILSGCNLNDTILAISGFEEATKKYLSGLTKLDLSTNSLATIPNIQHLENLVNLDLSDNRELHLRYGTNLIDYLPKGFERKHNATLSINQTRITMQEIETFREQSDKIVMIHYRNLINPSLFMDSLMV